MTTSSVSDRVAAADDERVLRAAVAAYLGRYRGESRVHTGSDLKVFLAWCSGEDLDPLALGRAEVERYVRWLQEVRCYQPSTVQRRLSVVVGFYRVCVIDTILAHSPADYVRRPPVPTESPTLGLGHLQFEALLTAARLSGNRNDFALIAMLGLLGLRIFEACGANIADLGEEHGHHVLKVRGKGGKTVLVPLPPSAARAIEHATAGRDQEPRPAPQLHPRRVHGLRNLTAILRIGKARAGDDRCGAAVRSALLGEALLTSRSVSPGRPSTPTTADRGAVPILRTEMADERMFWRSARTA